MKANSDYRIHTDVFGQHYQILPGKELAVALAGNAMKDWPLGKLCEHFGVMPGWVYKAYIDEDGSALSGCWEVKDD